VKQTVERFYVKHFLILQLLLSCSGSNEHPSKTNPELFQPREMQSNINGCLIFWFLKTTHVQWQALKIF